MPRRSPFHVPTRPIRRVACGAKPCGTLVRMVVRGLPCCLGSELGSLRGSLCDDPHPVESRIIGHFAKLQSYALPQSELLGNGAITPHGMPNIFSLMAEE